MITKEEKENFIKEIKYTSRDAFIERIYIRNVQNMHLNNDSFIDTKYIYLGIGFSTEDDIENITKIFPFLEPSLKENFIKDIKKITFSENVNAWLNGRSYLPPIEIGYWNLDSNNLYFRTCNRCLLNFPDYITVCPYCGNTLSKIGPKPMFNIGLSEPIIQQFSWKDLRPSWGDILN